MFLLDTNVVSELRKIHRTHAAVAAWAASTEPDQLFLSAITVFELERGALLAARRDVAQGTHLRAWLDNQVAVEYQRRTLPVDADAARAAASFHVPDPASYRDAFIGATALVHGLTLVTRNVGDFERFPGVRLLNPWAWRPA